MSDRYGNEYDDDLGFISFGDEREREREREAARGRAHQQGRYGGNPGPREPGRGNRDYGSEAYRHAGHETGRGYESGRGYENSRGFEPRYGQNYEGSGQQRAYSQERERDRWHGQGESEQWRGFDPWRSADRQEPLGWSRGGSGSPRAQGGYGSSQNYGRPEPTLRREGGFYGKGPKGYTRSDDRIRDDVSDRLTDDDELDASDITVTVKDGEVTLEGTVSDRRSKHRAEELADSVTGVKDVHVSLKTRKGFFQEMGDRITGRDEAQQHGHTGAGPRVGAAPASAENGRR